MKIEIIIAIIIIHFVADFILQTDSQAKGKSKNWSDLLSHTVTYSSIWLLVGFFIYLKNFTPYNKENLEIMKPYWNHWIPRGLLFVLITFVAHTITDYFTSRLNNKLLPQATTLTLESKIFGDNEMIAFPKNKSWHNFFVGIGFNQSLHMIQLILTFKYLSEL